MVISINQETVNDAAKLMMHRLISRQIGRDPSLVDRAKLSNAQAVQRYPGRPFVEEWENLLKLSPAKLRARLISRDSDMVRLRLSSPFLLASGVDFTDYEFRLRIRRAARRIVERGLGHAGRLDINLIEERIAATDLDPAVAARAISYVRNLGTS